MTRKVQELRDPKAKAFCLECGKETILLKAQLRKFRTNRCAYCNGALQYIKE